jgi:hypothetical protein
MAEYFRLPATLALGRFLEWVGRNRDEMPHPSEFDSFFSLSSGVLFAGRLAVSLDAITLRFDKTVNKDLAWMRE